MVAYNLALRLLRQEEDAEEIVQDAFLRAYRALPSFRREASFKTWILKIVHHLCLNRLRDQQRAGHRSSLLFPGQDPRVSPELKLVDTTGDPETIYLSKEMRSVVLTLIDTLPPKLRQVLILNSLNDLSYAEIAEVLQLPMGTVSSRIYSAREKLRKGMKKKGLLE